MPPPTALADYCHDLRQCIAGELRTDPYSLLLYSSDASLYQVTPLGVLIPRTVEDVLAAVSLAARYRIPLLPRASGSSLAGQAVNAAVVIDFTRHLDSILEINVEERRARVAPGVVLDDLNRQLRPHGLHFAPDPASSDRATLGGMVANNAAGAHSLVYGMTADHVLEMDVVLSDGSQATFAPRSTHELLQYQTRTDFEASLYQQIARLTTSAANRAHIVAATPRHWRRSGGYQLDRFVDGVTFHHPHDRRFNLAQLICGSEGTLAVMTALTLKLEPRPAHTTLALAHFASTQAALEATPAILETQPSAVELVDALLLQLAQQATGYRRQWQPFVIGRPACLLIIEYSGDSPAAVAARQAELARHLSRQGVPVVAWSSAVTPAEQAAVWQVRKVGLGLLMSLQGDHKPIPGLEDAAVPVEHLPAYIQQVEALGQELNTPITYYAHASVGCLHIRPLINIKQAQGVEKMQRITRQAAAWVKAYGGAFSSEHGDGRSRSWLNPFFFGPELYQLFTEVKGIFDPHNLFNPGNIVAAPGMTEHLRYGPDYQTLDLPTRLDFSADLGLARAVEMCNGAGVCRRRHTGTMCPSFQATREEEHSTRGRANALRAALSGQLPAEAWRSPRLYATLDLCLSCKACKAECPSSVDMARLKTEFLAHYYAVHGVPWRARLFGHIHSLSRLGSGPLAPALNWGLRRPAVARLLERWGGLSARRPLPALARQPFTHWWARRPLPPTRGNERVILFHDTFHTYHEPHVAIAAAELLAGLGLTVEAAGAVCCGRPAFSKGLLDLARRQARQFLRRMTPLAAVGLPIIGLEPGCLSVVRDDYAALLPGDERVAQVSGQLVSLEEYMAAQAARWPTAWRHSAGRALLHGHCHQKALVGLEPSQQTLALAGLQVVTLDAGCCGMAGAFGYEAEHVNLSLAIGELRLLPAVRAAAADDLIVAAGVSCRQQIALETGRRAWHPAEVLRQAMPT